MRLTAFQSDKGDCLLLEDGSGKHRMLIDGGMDTAYRPHVAPAMGRLRKAGKDLDVVYVSHIDEDHISGVLQLLDDEAAWRVHDHQVKTGNPNHPAPSTARPPDIGAIFHNSFQDQIRRNRGPIEDMLAATARTLSGCDDPWLADVTQSRRELVASIPQAMRVSQRIKPGQLNIPLNPDFDGKLMMIDPADPGPDLSLGSITLRVLGPFRKDLDKLRKEWNDWLEKHQAIVKTIRDEARRDRGDLGASDLDAVFDPMLQAADTLGALEIATAKKLGRRSRVTTPNLASLMFLVQEDDGRTLLLTGDGHADDILNGLDHHGAFDAAGRLHVTILKVQHHGAEHNLHRAFCDAITADQYVFCGNGEHQNPDLDVLQLIYDRRMANDQRKFRFWFNSTSTLSSANDGRDHMAKVEKLVSKLARSSSGRLTNKFITGSSMRITTS